MIKGLRSHPKAVFFEARNLFDNIKMHKRTSFAMSTGET